MTSLGLGGDICAGKLPLLSMVGEGLCHECAVTGCKDPYGLEWNVFVMSEGKNQDKVTSEHASLTF